jgi:hypothetical protein
MLNILYRGCSLELEHPPKREGRPIWFSKLKGFETLHNSIIKSNKNVKLTALMDGDKSELTDLIESYGYEVKFINAGSNKKSLQYQLDYANGIDAGDFYFVEDDYLHLPESISVLISGIHKFGLVTGYDHMDRYTRTDDLNYKNEAIYFHDGRHWRTCESTTCTWAIRNDMFKTVYPIAKQFLLEDRGFFRYLNIKGIKLHNPIPGVSTHVHLPYLSPGKDWNIL